MIPVEPATVIKRMRDVAMALGAASAHDEPLNRVRLQKFIYLMDSVEVLFDLLPPLDGHYTFMHGPFDPAIQNAVDCLAFRGFVKILALRKGDDNTLMVTYASTDAGAAWLQALERSTINSERAEVARAIATRVARLGWWRLKELVYAEPTFLATRPSGYGRRLFPFRGREASSARLLALIARSLSGSSHPDRELILDIYFEYLSKYALTHRHRTEPGETDK